VFLPPFSTIQSIATLGFVEGSNARGLCRIHQQLELGGDDYVTILEQIILDFKGVEAGQNSHKLLHIG